MSVAKLYTDELKRNFKILFANWEPGTPLELGVYGLLSNNIFVPLGNIKQLGVNFDVVTDLVKDEKEFKSEGGVEVKFNPKASVTVTPGVSVNANLEIKFTRGKSIFFHAAECSTNRIADKVKLGKDLKNLLKKGDWKKKYVVVTDLVDSGNTIIAVSDSKDANITFQASSPTIENINLADASIDLTVTTRKDIGYKVEAVKGLQILMGLCKFKNPFPLLGDGSIMPIKMASSKELSTLIEDAPEIKTEQSPDDLYFGQLGYGE